MAITKNRQSKETISLMAKRAFPDMQIAKIKELTEGSIFWKASGRRPFRRMN